MTDGDWARTLTKLPRDPQEVLVWADWLEHEGRPSVTVVLARLQAEFWQRVHDFCWKPAHLPTASLGSVASDHKRLYCWVNKDVFVVEDGLAEAPEQCRLPDFLFDRMSGGSTGTVRCYVKARYAWHDLMTAWTSWAQTEMLNMPALLAKLARRKKPLKEQKT